MEEGQEAQLKAIEERIGAIPDPEIPVVTLGELGMIRSVKRREDGLWEVRITPTYSGCPAYHWMEMEIRATLDQMDIGAYAIIEQLSPAWTTEWMGEEAREKLRKYGIAPPKPMGQEEGPVACPLCGSEHTHLVSEFGSTACKSFYTCKDCLEPFDHFKCH
jgi:ring-1,2-phenylacetyl-CoA epoxidase subunit PaaD